ncbi:hypothetical protein ACVWW1_004369 [Bradyrhizobium sp. JR3.5]
MTNDLRNCAAIALTIVASFWPRHTIEGEARNADCEALNKAIVDGKELRMLVDFSACQVHGASQAGPPIKASMRFDAYMIQPDGTIAFATTHFTVGPDEAVKEFLSFRGHASGKVEARTMMLEAVNDAVLKDTAFDCGIGAAVEYQADRNLVSISVVSAGFSSGKKWPPLTACPWMLSAHFRQIPNAPPSFS